MTLSPKWDLEQPSKTSHIVSSWRWKIMKRMMCTVFWSIKTFCIWQIHWTFLLFGDWPCCLACPSAGWSGADCEGRGQTPAGQSRWTPGTVHEDNHHTTTLAAGRLHSHLLGGCIHTCWVAAFTPAGWLHSHLAGCCNQTCQAIVFTPARRLHSHLPDHCIHTCWVAAFTPARLLHSHLPGHCIHTCKAAAFTPAWPLHSHLQGCCIHTCLATAFTPAWLLHSHLLGGCIHTCQAAAFTPARPLHSHLLGGCIHTCDLDQTWIRSLNSSLLQMQHCPSWCLQL